MKQKCNLFISIRDKSFLKIVYLFLVLPIAELHSMVQEKQSIQDRIAARQLFRQADRYQGQSQSYMHLMNPYVRKKMQELDNLDIHRDIIQQALAKELEQNKKGFVAFYSSVPYLRVLQDVTRKLYKRVVGRVGALQDKAFQFIRYSYNDPTYKKYNNATEFLVDEISREGVIDDNQGRLKTILVSTNLAFFGNIGLLGEFTYNYFNHPQQWVSTNPVWLQASLESFGYSSDFVDEFMELAKTIITGYGDLFQIFVPRSLVNTIGYLSWRHGIPFDVDYIQALMHRTSMTFSKSDKIFIEEVRANIADWAQKYKQGDATVVAAVDQLLKHIKEGKFHLIPFIDSYKSEQLPYVNAYQARLVIGPWLLDPTQGIKIFRYSTLTPEKEAEYRKKLSDIFDRMDAQKATRTETVNVGT